jgi:hypothetical protein
MTSRNYWIGRCILLRCDQVHRREIIIFYIIWRRVKFCKGSAFIITNYLVYLLMSSFKLSRASRA